ASLAREGKNIWRLRTLSTAPQHVCVFHSQDPYPGRAPALRRNMGSLQTRDAQPRRCGVIQVDPPFAEHLHTLLDVLVVITFWRKLEICSAGSISSNRAIYLPASSLLPASSGDT